MKILFISTFLSSIILRVLFFEKYFLCYIGMSKVKIDSPKPRPYPTDFDKFFPWVCIQNSVETEIIIRRVVQKPYKNDAAAVSQDKLSKKHPKHKLKPGRKPDLHGDTHSNTNSDTVESASNNNTSSEKSAIGTEGKVVIETIYNSDDDLVALKFIKNRAIPRKVIQLITTTFPYQKKLTSITINSGLRMDSLYEISKFLPNSQIIELCFDGTFLKEANYHILLTQSKLKHLSLARCTINDDVVKMITDQLKFPCPAAKVLSALNLSNNKITDTGAKYIADMLRTNRQLCYLNLAGNMITDEGGICILDTLQKFLTQSQELKESRARYVAYLREKNVLINQLVKELQTAKLDKNATKKKMTKFRKLTPRQSVISEYILEARIQDKAKRMANEQLGLCNEPFSPENTEVQDGVVYCLGNNTLCCLNLAYNNLSYISLKKLLEVLKNQKYLDRTPIGLIRVVTEGNLMPIACEEFQDIDRLLDSAKVNLINNKPLNVLKTK